MNRIEKKFESLKKTGQKALVAYVTCGDGGYDATEMAVLQMAKKGADMIEFGVPFTKLIIECDEIQKASARSLARGTTIAGIFDMIKRLRKQTDIPFVLALYLNLIYSFGKERFFAICNEIGIDGVIIPDMPYEERTEVQPFADNYGVIPISVIAPTSKERIKKIASSSKGYIYCACLDKKVDCREFVSEIKKHTDLPCILCSGISDVEQVCDIKDYCDGIVVEKAFVKMISKDPECFTKRIFNFTLSLREELDR